LYNKELFPGDADFESKRIKVRCAALLHDIGHGPFSHVFESVMLRLGSGYDLKHEKWSERIIKESTSSINQILCKHGIDPDEIADIISGVHKDRVIVNIVSGQSDADRMDYLQRDSLFTGVKYGLIDQDWLIHSLRHATYKGENLIAFDSSKGKNSILNFLLARRNLFEQVYFHHKIRSAEIQVGKIIARLHRALKENRDIVQNRILLGFMSTPTAELNIRHYGSLNDFTFISVFEEASKQDIDLVLQKLCRDFCCGRIFKSELIRDQKKLYGLETKLKASFESLSTFTGEHDYFFEIDSATRTYYENDYSKPRTPSESESTETDKEYVNAIWVLNESGQLEELSSPRDPVTSEIVKGLMSPVSRMRLCFDNDCFDRGQIRTMLN
jgi:HD superfamily phosphohydrolase